MYRLELRPSAAKDLDRLRGETWQRVKAALMALRNDPRPAGCIKLAGDGGWRIREGDWRVIYDIDDGAQVVTCCSRRVWPWRTWNTAVFKLS